MKLIILFAVIFIFTACSSNNSDNAIDSINKEDLTKHVEVLSSDGFEGRGPDSKGETLTINYLKDQFEKLGNKAGKRG